VTAASSVTCTEGVKFLTEGKSLVSEYRPCVVVVFTNPGGQVLACERADIRGAWQLPQGGIEPGESALKMDLSNSILFNRTIPKILLIIL
jgi:hypothetical protein